ncbi:hypothetical protein [Enterobacter asburiae]|uniref:phage tail fiber protein n=1 Tax=Enterobacter asburiae TaxID=61645 RepID=UPI000AD4C9A9|nr:hypothetical protein [Enterobacter asburiae]CAE7102402.1 hypothetical protein AI2694V1_3086 [Enterobacter cloacae]MEB2407185.1 hypothetical protein [Enterobacter asburiae]CAE7495652.1 hypothetical protein AI2674V1_3073 [Enterobacter cloacae]CAE7522509.1 hypothetical protein AI2679V1_3086 [Enterobacter cloacae]CAH3771360.1 hypothetical protein AI2679V1_3086 [Enterobacter cloacae]
MLRIGQVEATATQDGKYTDGSVAGGIAATRLRAAAFNAMQEELAHIVESAGLALDINDMTQVLKAIQKLTLSRANPFADIKSDGAAAISTALTNLGLKEAAKRDVGNTPGDVVTAGSDQPVYNSTLPTSGYTSIEPSGYMGAATVTGGDTLVRLIGLIAHNIAGNWTIVNSYGSHFGTGDSIDPNDAAHVFVSTDGASYTRRWYLYNNGNLRGPAGDFGDMAWVNNKVGTVDGVITLGNGINVKKVNIPDLPLIGYTGTSSRGILSTATGQADSVTKAHSIQLTKPGAGGWGLTMSWGTYVGVSGSVDGVAHLLCASDGAAFSRNWWFYNNGDLVGPGGKFYSEKNTTRAADGTLKTASPVIKLFSDGRAETNAESEGCTVTRLSVGEYLISGCIGLNADAAWGGTDGGFDVPTDRNKQPLIWLDYEINPDGSVLVKTYHRTHPDSPVFARNEREGYSSGDPIDIPTDQFVSVRVEMPEDSVYRQKQEAERKAAYEAWVVMLQQAEEDAYQEDQLRETLRKAEEERKAMEEEWLERMRAEKETELNASDITEEDEK